MRLVIKGLHKNSGKWVKLVDGVDTLPYDFDSVPSAWLVENMKLTLVLNDEAFGFNTGDFSAFSIKYKD